jgi:hypothetical protein
MSALPFLILVATAGGTGALSAACLFMTVRPPAGTLRAEAFTCGLIAMLVTAGILSTLRSMTP